MSLNRNINDDSTLAYLFNKTRQGASDALDKAIAAVKELFVKKSGDTMTGGLVILRPSGVGEYQLLLKSTNDDLTNATDTDIHSNSVLFRDKNDHRFGVIRSKHNVDGSYGLWIAGLKSDGSVGSGVQLLYNGNNPAVVIDSPGAWRSALGLGSIATVNSPVPVANGGTGATSAAKAKENLDLGSEAQNFAVAPSGAYTGQIALFGFTDLNSESAYNGHRMSIVVNDTGLSLWDETSSTSRWSLNLPLAITSGGSGQTDASVTSTISDIATAGSNITIADASFAKWGEVGQIRLRLTATANIAANSVVATIKTGKRPAITTSLAEMNNKNTAWVSASNPGQISINSAISSGSGVILQGTYIIGNA